MMETVQSIQNISCRICRESACRKKVTFELDSIWSSLFEFCLGFQITRSGPLSFCETCSNKLHDYGEFKKLCLKSEEIWKSLTNSFPVRDHSEDKLNIVQEDSVEENTGYPDTFDHDDNDYNVILIVKEESENSAKKLEKFFRDKSIKKIEKLLVKDKEPTDQSKYEKKFRKTSTKSSKITKSCKYSEKRDKNLKTKSNQKPKSSKNDFDVSVKQEVTDLYCGLCDFTSTSSVEVKQHLIRHCQENYLKCQLCCFEGKDVAHMISHRYTHCPQLGRKRECPLCSAVFFSGRKLQFHYRSVHLETKGGLCIICGRTYRSYKQWRGHETGHVTRNFICDHCGLSFVQRNQIEDHMVVHSDIFNFICDLCGKVFRKKGNLKSHYFNHHTEHKKVTCTICSTKFKHELYLTRHMQQQHGEKKYLCKLCSKGFCTNRILRDHMFHFHSDERPYACDLCGATFRAHLNLKIHQRIHTGELPYPCPECGKGFRSSTARKAHQSVHTGVRPFKCLHCDKMFNCKKRKQAHYNSKHKDALRKGELKL